MAVEVFETEFRLTSNGPQAVISAYGGATQAADKATQAANKANAAVQKFTGAKVGYTGAIPPRADGLPSAGGYVYNGAIPPAISSGGGLDATISRVASGLGGAVESLGGAIPIVKNIAGTFIAAAGTIAAIIGGSAVKGINAATDRDTLERMLGDVQGGNLGRGQSTYRAIQEYDKTSNFQIDTNANAAVRLIGSDMPWEKWLKVSEKFARGDAQRLDQLVGAITRIKAGGVGEGLESLRDAASIGRPAFEAEGIKFGKNGVLSSPAEILAALERIAAKRGNLVGDGLAARRGNVDDQIANAWSQFGMTIKDSILPLMERFGDSIENLTKNGAIDQIGEAFNGMLSALTDNGSLSDLFFEVSVNMAEFFDTVTVLKGAFDGLVTGVNTVADNFGRLILPVVNLIELIGRIPGIGGYVNANIRGTAVGLGGGLGGTVIDWAHEFTTGPVGRREAMENERRMQDELRKKRAGRKLIPFDVDPLGDPADGPPGSPDAIGNSEATAFLRTIAANTQRQADLSERLLGGGTASRGAFSDASVGKILGSDPITQRVVALVDAVRAEMATQFRNQARQGL